MKNLLVQRGLYCIAILLVLASPIWALDDDDNAEFPAKGFNVVSVTVETKHKVSDFDLQVSFDGETFRNCGVGLPRPWRLFYSIDQTQESATITVPVVGGFSGIRQFLFIEPGQRWFRWKIQYEGDFEPDVIEQSVEIRAPLRADLDFIAGLADRDLALAMFGEDFFARQTGEAIEKVADPEFRSIGIIGYLLYATRDKLVGDAVRHAGPKGDMQKVADSLLDLAKEFPDSSYAPYAAYYAGCCYASMGFDRAIESMRAQRRSGELKDDLEEIEKRISIIQADADCLEGYNAFTFAAERADAYLGPRVLYQRVLLRASAGKFDEAERILAENAELDVSDDKVQKWIDEVRAAIKEVRPKLQQATIKEETGSPP